MLWPPGNGKSVFSGRVRHTRTAAFSAPQLKFRTSDIAATSLWMSLEKSPVGVLPMHTWHFPIGAGKRTRLPFWRAFQE